MWRNAARRNLQKGHIWIYCKGSKLAIDLDLRAQKGYIMVSPGIVEINLHGFTKVQARVAINRALISATGAVYRIRLVHGYQHGTELRDMIRGAYKKHPKVLRLELGLNPGQTDLVLREF